MCHALADALVFVKVTPGCSHIYGLRNLPELAARSGFAMWSELRFHEEEKP